MPAGNYTNLGGSLENCMSGLRVENAKYCTLLALLTQYVDDIGFCYGKSCFRVSLV